jgi:serine protease
LCRPREDDESAFDFFQDLVEGIASLFGYEQEPVFDFSIVDGELEISVRIMLPVFARLLARLPFMGPVVQDERRILNLPSNNEDFSPYDGEILTYGLQMVGALDVATGSAPRKVCIIDSGYSLGHVDLPSDVDGLDGDAQGPWENDGNGHGKLKLRKPHVVLVTLYRQLDFSCRRCTNSGTHVAGTIAAIGGNNQGVVGVAGNGVELFIVKALGDDGTSWASDFIQYVRGCVDNGANVVSMSLGGYTYFQYEDEGFQALYDQGILFVAAAGNDGDSTYTYPASYPSVISVAAVDRYKNVADFSQANDQVELSGPGVEILSTLPDNSYGIADGTSMACPHVSGE